MRDEGGKRQYETLVYMIVVSLACLVFYFWVERLAVKVEQSKIQYMLSNIGAVIKVRELTAIVSDRGDELAEYHLANPMDFFETPPPEYAGEETKENEIKTGSWFFDPENRQLVYPVISVDSNPEKLKQLRYQLQYAENTNSGVGRLRLIQIFPGDKEIKDE